MSGYNDITVQAPEHYAKPYRVMRTDSEIKFTENGGQQGIQFYCGGHGYFFSYDKVISIVPVKED